MPSNRFSLIAVGFFLIHLLLISNFAQEEEQTRRTQNDSPQSNQKVRSVTIPVSIFTRRESKEKQGEEFVQAGNISVREDGDEQVILSIRSVGSDTPLAIAVLIQDDLTSDINLQLPDIRRFVRNLPLGSRVMVAYLRGGSLQIREKFTEDLEKAASSIRIVTGSAALAPASPYEQVDEALKRFDALPNGRRAVLLVSDGLDASRGIDNFSQSQSIDLDRAILKAQRKSIAVYSFYNAATFTENGSPPLVLNGQSSLERLSSETGGRAFFQGTSSPVSFVPFFRDLNTALNRQFALTYLSTHFKKGYHKIDITSTNPDVKINHPKGYFYR